MSARFAPSLRAPKGDANENPSGVGFWRLVKEDLATHGGDLFAQGFWAIFNHRFGNWRMGVRSRLARAPLTAVYRAWYKLVQILAGVDLPYTVKLGRRVRIEHFGGMVLVARSIGDDVVIRQNTTFGVRSADELHANPVICDKVDIGVGAVILGAVTIGEGAVIGANAVVLDDVPPYAVAAGVPAKVVRMRQLQETAAKSVEPAVAVER